VSTEPAAAQDIRRTDLYLGKELLWADLHNRERKVAKEAFPDALERGGGLNQTGLNLVAAIRLFFDLVKVIRHIDSPLSKIFPSFAALRADTDHALRNLSVDRYAYVNAEPDADRKVAKPWHYHKIKSGTSLEFVIPDPIPESWKTCRVPVKPEVVYNGSNLDDDDCLNDLPPLRPEPGYEEKYKNAVWNEDEEVDYSEAVPDMTRE
jgi:hypothetical protein